MIIAALALSGVTFGASAAGPQKYLGRSAGARPAIEERRATVAEPQAPAARSEGGLTVIDKPYDAPLPIGTSAAGAEPGLPIAKVVPPPPPPPVWSVKAGGLLSDTLREWSETAGWALVWQLPQASDFRMDASNRYQGEFKNAVTELINSLPASVRIHAELRSENAPPLLYVTRDEGSR